MTALGISGLDHTLVGVRDLEAARAAWQRLGFTSSPRGRHIGWGTANYCLMFHRGYVELLGVVDPAQFTNNLDRFLERREGLMGLAFATADAAGTAERLHAAGIASDGPKDLKRLIELPEGEAVPEFKLVFLPETATPDLSAFACQHLTPDLVRPLGWTVHRNRAARLDGVTILSESPQEAARGYAPLFGPASVTIEGGEGRVETGGGHLRFLAPSAWPQAFPGQPLPDHPRPWIAAMTIGVLEIAATADYLAAGGIAWTRSRDGIAIAPEAATGVVLEFVP